MITGIIYSYTSPSNKKYIGQTINEIKRKNRFKDLTKIYAGGGKLENARKKYLPENFKYEILESIKFECKDDIGEILNDLEIKYIKLFDTFKTGYNSSIGGKFSYSDNYSISHLGKKHTEETKIKISESIKRVKQSENYFQNPMSIENKEKMSKRQSKEVLQFDINGNFLKEWKSGKIAGEEFNIDPSGILKCCNKKNKTSAGFIWRFKNEYIEIPIKIEISLSNLSKINSINSKNKVDCSNKNKVSSTILQYDLNNNFIKEWNSVASIYKELDKNGGGMISKCCTGKLKTAYGFIWKYKYIN